MFYWAAHQPEYLIGLVYGQFFLNFLLRLVCILAFLLIAHIYFDQDYAHQ